MLIIDGHIDTEEFRRQFEAFLRRGRPDAEHGPQPPAPVTPVPPPLHPAIAETSGK